jgi:hypothetical protein
MRPDGARFALLLCAFAVFACAMVNASTVIPRGADVMTKLIYDQNAGKLQGRTVLTPALVSVRTNGR